MIVAMIQGNYRNTRDLEVNKGYEIIALFLKKKYSMITMDTIEILLQLVGSTNDPKENVVANHLAFKHFILYYDLWKYAPLPIQQRILQFISSLMVNNFQNRFNVLRLRRLSMYFFFYFQYI